MFKRPSRPPALPLLLQRRHTDEFSPPPYGARDRAVVSRVLEEGPRDARRLGMSLGDYWSGRAGTAAGLRALNDEWGAQYYQVPEEATLDRQAAEHALGGDELVIDVQTHYISDRALEAWKINLHDMYRSIAPSWWKGVDGVERYDLAEYLRCVFLESQTALAVLTSGPGLTESRMLFNREMAATRELFERVGASGRILNHSVIHADVPGEIESMEREVERYQPVGWKCYTMSSIGRADFEGSRGWWLDDERTGIPFIEKAIELGVPLICAHKGISQMVNAGSPRDVGIVAKAFPQVSFVIYHSGYEFPEGEEPEEGPYTEETVDQGVNRLVKSVYDAGLAPGANVYAELGTTWFGVVRRPVEAAHVLGKLLVALGEDNVIWGTDAIWYGPTQVSVDAFRAFQIPVELRERYGYPELTPEIKAKILGLNAARVYGIDPERARENARTDNLAWTRQVLQEYEASGTPSL